MGIYSAWAKVRTKRYFYGNTYVDNDNFEYHAVPMQILKRAYSRCCSSSHLGCG
nr:YjgN family protein [Vibrio neptunius]